MELKHIRCGDYLLPDLGLIKEEQKPVGKCTRKQHIIYSKIMLPANAPPQCMDRVTFWNSVYEAFDY